MGALLMRHLVTRCKSVPSNNLEPPRDAGLEERLDRYSWCFLNHSCHGNSEIEGRALIAKRTIAAWEQINFEYDASEYDMAEPLDCSCGNSTRGYRWLSAETRRVGQRTRGPRPKFSFATLGRWEPALLATSGRQSRSSFTNALPGTSFVFFNFGGEISHNSPPTCSE
ncbi:MAG: hypothetical protein V3W41_00785 [Planctomycetota bacterium]